MGGSRALRIGAPSLHNGVHALGTIRPPQASTG